MKYLLTLSLVLLMVGVAGGYEPIDCDNGYPESCIYIEPGIEVAGEMEPVETNSMTICNGPIEACSFNDESVETNSQTTFVLGLAEEPPWPTNGLQWDIIMPFDCDGCIEVKSGGVVVRIWPDGTVERLEWKTQKDCPPCISSDSFILPYEYPDNPCGGFTTWPPNQG